MKRYLCSVALTSTVAVVACGGAPGTTGEATSDEATGTVQSAISGQCYANGTTAHCDTTGRPSFNARNYFYAAGATSGPGYNSSTGEHNAVILFQGTSPDICLAFCSDNGTGGSLGPGATWGQDIGSPGSYGVYYQVATVAALVNAGYTVIQPAAHLQCAGNGVCGGYFWDTNAPSALLHAWPGSADQVMMSHLVENLQPGSTTFGKISINHVYAMGISSGGYMSSRVANEFASGLNSAGGVNNACQPVRAVAIEDGAWESCSGWLNPQLSSPFFYKDQCTTGTLGATHPPSMFLHDPNDAIVPYSTMSSYVSLLASTYPNGNANYRVNGTTETYVEAPMTVNNTPQEQSCSNGGFNGTASPGLHHQWDSNLTGDSNNLILQWFNQHNEAAGAAGGAGEMMPGTTLTSGQTLYSPDSSHYLTMQTDGNLVLYKASPKTAIWASNTVGSGATHATMQSDSNFVVYNSSQQDKWSSGTFGQQCAYLAVQNDGNMVLYNNGSSIWSTNTAGH